MKLAPLNGLVVLLLAANALAQSGSLLLFQGQQVEIVKPAFEAECQAAAKSPAKLCLKSSQLCYTPPEKNPPFGFDPKASIVRLSPAQDAVLFTAISSACGSGSSEAVALLNVHYGQWEDLLPDVSISNQGEFKLWTEPAVSSAAIFLTADYVWGDGESHFARHRYRITTYVMGKELGIYYLRDEYVTSQKYPSYDEADKINVLEREKSEILTRLQRQKD